MKRFFILLLFSFSSFISSAQLVDSMLNVYALEVPDQKVHVHFDKDIYRAGETIWFKAYLFSGFSPAVNSKNFYSELIDGNGNVLQRKVEPITEATSFGFFDLPDTFPAGNVVFRGYTTWQLNFDTAFLFQKTIAVVAQDGSTAKPVKEAATNVLLQFFPEGGNLVNGLPARLAFKANDERGMPAVVNGSVLNSKGEVVTHFSALHDGMGSFNITPQAGETYSAIWKDAAGKEHTTPLPASDNEGCVLNITSSGSSKLFTITRTEHVPDDWKKVYIVALFGQEKVYRAKASLVDKLAISGSIPVAQLPSGILQVTLFSESWQPIAERIVFVNNGNYTFDASVHEAVVSTKPRARNVLEVEVPDTLLSNMSLAVTDAGLGKQSNADNIISRMLLTGDIKGYVHEPAYYFINNSDSVAAALDLVMLTHGWRRYNWSLLAAGKKPPLKFPDDAFLSINVKAFGVTTASPMQPDEAVVAFMTTKDSIRQVLTIPKVGTDRFALPNVFFFDTATLHYSFAKEVRGDDKWSVGFSNNFYRGVKRVRLPAAMPMNIQQDIAVVNRAKQFAEKASLYNPSFGSGVELKTVVVSGKQINRGNELDKRYTSGLFSGGDAVTFDFTNDKNIIFTDVLSYLQGRVAGLTISGSSPNIQLSWRGGTPALYLDQMPADVQLLTSINSNDIAYVKVFRPPFMGAMGGGSGGAIAVYTKKGGDRKPEPGKGLAKAIVTGYSPLKEFYSPNYSDAEASANTPADYRTTLYWKPVLATDAATKKVRIEFYNNDMSKAFRVVLEGINEAGKVVRIEKVIHD